MEQTHEQGVKAILDRLPLEFLQKHMLLPIEGGERLQFGYVTRDSLAALEDVRLVLDREIEPVQKSREEVEEGLRQLMMEGLGSTPEDDEAGLVIIEDETTDLMRVTAEAPIVQLVNAMLLRAVDRRASDIHLEPFEDALWVRMRIDGVLQKEKPIPRARHSSVVARIKVMAKLNLAESRLPQDGRLKVRARGRDIDVRVSILPTQYGERVVLRILDRGTRLLSLQEVGLIDESYDLVHKFGLRDHGLILATGPTGSGKSTTLYGLIQEVRSPTRNIITIEDPVEYQAAGVGQIQVNTRIGLTFAAGLRSILRQDPDVIMVGEIRDSETADIAIHAALTGHLVLSTLHTNDAPTAVSRLIDMNVEPYLISASLLGVIAQRLVRRLCTRCRLPRAYSDGDLVKMGVPPELVGKARLYEARDSGCEGCGAGKGYTGRTGIFEVLEADEEVGRLIVRSGEAAAIRAAARKNGMRTLLEDGVRKAIAGVTSLDEVVRVAL